MNPVLLLRRLVLVASPPALAMVLWWHPAGGENVYEGVRDDVDAWLFVHAAMLVLLPLWASPALFCSDASRLSRR